MNCQELIFNLFAIYVVPKSESQNWVSYPWNVPYDESVATINLSQMGFVAGDGKTAFSKFIDKISTFRRFTSYDCGNAESNLVIYCDEQMSASAKPKTQTAGLMWENTVKCTAIHPTSADIRAMADIMKEPHDLILVSDENDFFLLRTPEEAYKCEAGQQLGSGWRHDVQFTIQNCHGMQLIDIEN